ncbi:hypothetical protein EHP00_631 [Ecytonucleospora hepatopenaei]|uniref:Uncharacterized protein n=1 Tax=Ecytonucleospora hepatopenaei TaxID=646526 RepID=A0A1W0E2L9_9MICR|nr:hypothetical protein EHP00_631 [Ecytonucleospora hepatopenaei]
MTDDNKFCLNNSKDLSDIQKKALKYYEKTKDMSLLHFFFEPFEKRNYYGDDILQPHCNSLFISRVKTNKGIFLHKSENYIQQRENAMIFLNEKISDEEIN